MATSSAASEVASSQSLKRNSNDMTWEFAMLCDPNDLQRVKCKLCGKQMSGGVNRMKQHIVQIRGSVTSSVQGGFSCRKEEGGKGKASTRIKGLGEHRS